MFSTALLLLTLAASSAYDANLPLFDWGPSAARGVLANVTVGARPTDPIDPARPTVVVVHGSNPFNPALHFTIARRYAEALGRRIGAGVNVLGWDWNADTIRYPFPRCNQLHAIAQGRALAAALDRSGVDPARLHLIGQSSGCLLAASAARLLADGGRPPARLTLLDPAVIYHDLLFGALRAGTAAGQVEHVWVDGVTGYGREAPYPGVRNARLVGSRGVLGLIRPTHSDHLDVIRWHIGTLGR